MLAFDRHLATRVLVAVLATFGCSVEKPPQPGASTTSSLTEDEDAVQARRRESDVGEDGAEDASDQADDEADGDGTDDLDAGADDTADDGDSTLGDGTDASDDSGTSPEPQLVELRPIYRLVKGDHIHSNNPTEGTSIGYVAQGVIFHLATTQVDGTAPLYRCWASRGVHFLSRDAACEGQTVEGILGYLATTALPNTKLISRCRNADASDSIALYDTANCTNQGYTVEGPLGYIPQAGFSR